MYFVCFCFIPYMCCITVSAVGCTWWDWSLILRTCLPSVLWHCWLGHLKRKIPSPIWPIMCLVWCKPCSVVVVCFLFFYASTTSRRQRHHFPVIIQPICPLFVHQLVLCMRRFYLIEGFQWNLPLMFVMWVGVAEKFFEVRGHMHTNALKL